jgi:cytochrome c
MCIVDQAERPLRSPNNRREKSQMANMKMSRRAALTLAIAGASGFAPQVAQVDAEDRAKGQTSPVAPATAPALRDLKMVGPESLVTGIGHVDATFEVKTADGRKTSFSETSLRFKIDSSEFGPPTGRPVILPGGMIGDRATVFFASAAEIGILVRWHD